MKKTLGALAVITMAIVDNTYKIEDSDKPMSCGEWVACPVCDTVTHESNMVGSRYNKEVSICETCKDDGN